MFHLLSTKFSSEAGYKPVSKFRFFKALPALLLLGTFQVHAQSASPASAAVAAGPGGFSLTSADGQYQLRLRADFQFDGRFFEADGAGDSLLVRRIRPTFQGQLGSRVGFRFTPELVGTHTLLDAYLDIKLTDSATLRAGLQKSPIGLELLQAVTVNSLAEQGFVTAVVPNRDLGLVLQGNLASSKVNYALGVFNGAPDGANAPVSDGDEKLEFIARVFVQPWTGQDHLLSGLGFGIAGSTGEKQGAGTNFLPRYRSFGRQTIFGYRAAVEADGNHRRVSPQFSYYRGPFSLVGEYVTSAQKVSDNLGNNETIDNKASQLTLTYVLTGENVTYGGVRPAKAFDNGGWGAFEVALRWTQLEIDEDAFPLFADSAASIAKAETWALGLNWYLSRNLTAVLSTARTAFDGGAAGGGNRADENVTVARVQYSF